MADSEKEGRTRRPITYDDRVAIEHGLNRGDRIAWIARSIGRIQLVVAEEVKRNWTDDPRGHLTIQDRNICVKYATCEVRRLCKTMCKAPCRKCRDWLCNSLCPDFECAPCPKLEHTPFCCNSCNQRQGYGCSHLYRFYEAKYAQDLADARRSEARSGVGCDPEAFEHAIDVIKDGLSKGQSPQHIIAANPDDIPFGVRSLYNLPGGRQDGHAHQAGFAQSGALQAAQQVVRRGKVAPDTARGAGRPPLVGLPGA